MRRNEGKSLYQVPSVESAMRCRAGRAWQLHTLSLHENVVRFRSNVQAYIQGQELTANGFGGPATERTRPELLPGHHVFRPGAHEP
jgi:hypothetical protein